MRLPSGDTQQRASQASGTVCPACQVVTMGVAFMVGQGLMAGG